MTTEPAKASKILIDAELIHNWVPRYSHCRTGPLGELPQDVRADILRAHMAHNRNGRDAQELAVEVAARHPGLLYAEGSL